MKAALCKEFCDQIRVRSVPAGLAVGTQFTGIGGDPIGFYVIGPNSHGQFRIEDNGTTVPILEACGADLELESRAEALRDLLNQYHVEYDEERGELKTSMLTEREIPRAALSFVAFLLRLQDLLLMTKERAENTFRQEALRDLQKAIGEKAVISLDEPVSKELGDFRPDAVIRAPQRPPVALFLVMGDAKLYEAMLLQMEAELKVHVPCKVIALMEQGEDSVSKKTFKQAMNRLIPLRYRGDENEAINRIVRETFINESVH